MNAGIYLAIFTVVALVVLTLWNSISGATNDEIVREAERTAEFHLNAAASAETVESELHDLKGIRKSKPAGASAAEVHREAANLIRNLAGRAKQKPDPLAQIVRLVVTVAVLGAGLFIILSGRYDASAEKFATGSIGTILGYWLKG